VLTARRQQRAVDRFIKDFAPRHRALTLCLEGYVVAECGGALPSPVPAQGR
jgi:hypothetical protein